MNQCKRCGQDKDNTDALSQALVHFVCRDCRADSSGWNFYNQVGTIPYTIESMEKSLHWYQSDDGEEEWMNGMKDRDNG